MRNAPINSNLFFSGCSFAFGLAMAFTMFSTFECQLLVILPFKCVFHCWYPRYSFLISHAWETREALHIVLANNTLRRKLVHVSTSPSTPSYTWPLFCRPSTISSPRLCVNGLHVGTPLLQLKLEKPNLLEIIQTTMLLLKYEYFIWPCKLHGLDIYRHSL